MYEKVNGIVGPDNYTEVIKEIVPVLISTIFYPYGFVVDDLPLFSFMLSCLPTIAYPFALTVAFFIHLRCCFLSRLFIYFLMHSLEYSSCCFPIVSYSRVLDFM